MSYDQQLSQPPGPQGAYPPPPQPQPQGRSGLAIAGLILAFFVPPVGFILSLIAAITTRKPRKGRGMAVAGLIISTLIIGGTVAAVLALTNSTLADPGCTSGKQVILDYGAKSDPASIQKMVDGLNAAAAKAKHDDVRNAMKALADDYTQLQNAVKTGNLPDGLQAKINADASKIDTFCTIGS